MSTPAWYGLLVPERRAHREVGLYTHTRPGRTRPAWAQVDQYEGSDGSTWLTQASTPPPTCTASAKPASLTMARHSALRAPLLQCRTIRRSWGSRSRAAPDRNSPFGISTEPGIDTISYSFGSRTSTRNMLSSPSSIPLSWRALIVERVIDHQPPDQRVADPGDDLDRLVDLDGPDRGAEHAEDSALGARGHHARRRRFRVQAAVARAVLGPEDAGLSVEPVDRSPDVGLAEQHARVVDQVAGGEVVGAVHDQVVGLEHLHRVVGVQPLFVHDHVHQRVEFLDAVPGGLCLRAPHIGLAVDDLPLQVGLVHDIEVDDTQRANPGRSQVQQRRRSKTARSHTQHLGVLQALLPGHPHVGNDQVT